jgi:hypothetical protein
MIVFFIWFFQVMLESSQGGPGRRTPPPNPDMTLLVVALVLFLIGLVPATYLSIRCFVFAPWFVIDRACGPMDAIKGNWALTQGHFWGWFGISLLLSLIQGVASMPCYLGLPFALPLYYLVFTAAWMKITRPPALEGGPL